MMMVFLITALCWLLTIQMGINFVELLAVGQYHIWLNASFWALFAMWVIMMAAMMLPSFIPTLKVLLNIQKVKDFSTSAMALFISAYLFIWIGFSLVATVLQQIAVAAGLLNTELFLTESAWRGGLLIAAGLFQLTPLKSICLDKCRHPVFFFMLHWRNHAWGALQMGMRNGFYCLGCCWLLMLLLFVGGIMNITCIIILTLYVLIEKTIGSNQLLLRGTGGLLIMIGLFQLLM